MSEIVEKTPPEEDKKKKKDAGPSPRMRLYEYASGFLQLWRTPSGEPYADITHNNARLTKSLNEKWFDSWLRNLYVRMTGGNDIPPEGLVEIVHKHLQAEALLSKNVFKPHMRVCRDGNSFYYDLNNKAGTIIKCSSEGWEEIPKNGIKFTAGDGMLPQVTPARGGSLDILRKYLHTASEDDFRLILAFLVGSFVAAGGYPILILNGGQGTAKSTITDILQSLIDPSALQRRENPKDAKDVGSIVFNSHLLTLDNITQIKPWLSDMLCRLSTGGTIGGREFYTLRRDAGFEAIRPVIINGIPQFVEKGDLMERSVLLVLPKISDDIRRNPEELMAEFEKEKPLILGALFDVICTGLTLKDVIKPKKLPRLAFWGLFMESISPVLGWGESGFMKLWEAQEATKSNEIVGQDALAQAIWDTLCEKRDKHEDPVIKGTMKEIMMQITMNEMVGDRSQKSLTPKWFATHLRQIDRDLSRMGVEIFDGGRSNKGNRYEIRLVKK